jgi:hypothetical protein
MKAMIIAMALTLSGGVALATPVFEREKGSAERVVGSDNASDNGSANAGGTGRNSGH